MYGRRIKKQITGDKMIIKDALQKGISLLKSVGTDSPVLEAGMVLCYVMNCEETFIYSHNEENISNEKVERYFSLLQDRAKGKPVQYITGQREFMGLVFTVAPGVLIPRQDTEILVEAAIDYCKNICVDNIYLLDIGTGCGCIAISMAYYIKNCHAVAVDICTRALDLAHLNAVKLKVSDRVEFVNNDVFSKSLPVYNDTKYDVIVSNPPYIPEKDIMTLQIKVKEYEPTVALDGGSDGLDFYEVIIKCCLDFLKPHGLLAVEVGIGQSDVVARLMSKYFYDICKINDLSGIGRVVSGRLCI